METKTTIDILNENEVQSDEYDYLYQRIANISSKKWVNIESISNVLKEMELKANKVMNNYDLNMSERKGAYIMYCELIDLFKEFRKVK